jgi:molybdate transport system substrate-binding protein
MLQSSSSKLVTVIESGAGVDVFASADQANMDKLKNETNPPVVFAKHQLEIATKPGYPKKITRLPRLPTAGIIALCDEKAPCGKYADQILKKASVTIPANRITRDENATQAVGQVAQGDADAGIVYVTDVQGAGSSVDGVQRPVDQNAIAISPIATLKKAPNAQTAQAFVDYVNSSAGQKTLQSYGFLAP